MRKRKRTLPPEPAGTGGGAVRRVANPKIRLENVTYIYGRRTPFETRALDGVSLDIRRGILTGIIGHTGSGKSTLIRLLNGLYRPASGRVFLDGEDIWEKPSQIGKIRFRVGLVMQYPEHQLFEETVRADIAFGPKNMGLPPEEIRERIEEAAAFAGVGRELMDVSPFDLSGGQKRRVAIAGVMAMRPEVLVLDEPASGLDPQGRCAVFDGIRDYNRRTGATVVVVSHSMEDMAQYCDEVVVLSRANVLMAGSRDEVFSRAADLEAVGLDVPQITRLTEILREAGMPLPAGLYTPEAAEDALRAAFLRAREAKGGRA